MQMLISPGMLHKIQSQNINVEETKTFANMEEGKTSDKLKNENGKIISSSITSVSFGKQKKLTREIKKAKILGLL